MRWKLGPIDLSGRETQRRNTSDATTLRGFALSPGRVTAPARVILSPADFGKMEPGTTLVCPRGHGGEPGAQPHRRDPAAA